MPTTATRGLNEGIDLETIDDRAPLKGVVSLSGVRVYKVGQGDSIAVLDGNHQPVLQIDYGGRQNNPFVGLLPKAIDAYLPVKKGRLVMLTHWDEDHWCTADKAYAVQHRKWLVPRQVTSARAVKFSTTLKDQISCIPDDEATTRFSFKALNGDAIYWEKINRSKVNAKGEENCNKTGVAFSIIKHCDTGPDQVILAPGDAPYHLVSHYKQHLIEHRILRGVVAFHHGANTHWTNTAHTMLKDWPQDKKNRPQVVFSCGEGNPFEHPFEENYRQSLGPNIDVIRTFECQEDYVDIHFV